MKLTETHKNAVKSTAKQLIDVKGDKTADLDSNKLEQYINDALSFLGLNADNDEMKDLIQDLEYEVSVHHTTGSVIYNDYENSHDWYSNLTLEKQPFWDRYRRFLMEKTSLGERCINLLGDKTLPAILNCLENPNEDFEGKRLRRGLIIGDVQSGKTSTYIGLICKAADAGYKVIILLAGTTESLRQQTQERIDEGIIGYTFPKDNSVKTGVKVGVGE